LGRIHRPGDLRFASSLKRQAANPTPLRFDATGWQPAGWLVVHDERVVTRPDFLFGE
jgi:hypothetical protein